MSTRGTKLQLEMPRSWFQIRLGSLDRNQIFFFLEGTKYIYINNVIKVVQVVLKNRYTSTSGAALQKNPKLTQ